MNSFLMKRPWQRLGLLIVLIVILPVVVFAQEETEHPERRRRSYTPLITASRVSTISCEIPGQQYVTQAIAGEPVDIDVAADPDFNLGVRGYRPTTAALGLVELGPVWDPRAPQFATLFANEYTPTFSNAYKANGWDRNCNCPVEDDTPWETTVLGMVTTPGEIIGIPDSGYDIGGGRDAMVLYAGATRLTLHVGTEDDFNGYVMHIEDVCIEPDLLALYQATNAAGRHELPVLFGRQPFGRASSNEIKIAIRDGGGFLDPRSRNDWWQGR